MGRYEAAKRVEVRSMPGQLGRAIISMISGALS
jgi:hypothetical protein